MKLLCFGEIVWDEIAGRRVIGGGPFNVAAHARILGVDEVFLFSAVGSDALGAITRDVVRQSGVNDAFLKTADTDTCVVKVALDPCGNATFTIPDPTSFDQIDVTDDDVERISTLGFDCFYFGTIAQRRARSRASLRRLIEQGGFRHAFCDVNLRMNFHDPDVLEWSLRHSDTVKLNEEEASVVRQLCGIDEPERRQFCERLQHAFGIRWICLTGGEQGAWISSPQGFEYSPAAQVDVVDTVGAGDAFAAAFLHGLDAGWSLREIVDFANRVGALVVSREGAVPVWTIEEVKRPFGN